MSGLGIAYEPSMPMAKPIERKIEVIEKPVSTYECSSSPMQLDTFKPIRLSVRMPSTLVLGRADSQPHELQRLFPSTGEWDLVVFRGTPLVTTSAITSQTSRRDCSLQSPSFRQ